MYQKSKIYLLGCLTILLIYACSNADGPLGESTTNKISFVSTIDNNNFGGINTKAINSSWEAQDKIGVFMYQDGQQLQESAIINGVSNYPFTTTGNGIFNTQDGKEVFFPKDVEKVNFIAYYPYSNEINNLERAIDVSEQSNPAKINLMYSNNLKSNSANASRELLFKHMLSRVQFDIKAKPNVSLADLSIEVNNVPVKAVLNLEDGSLKIDNTSIQASVVAYKESDTKYSAFLLPTNESTIKFTIRIKGKAITKTSKTVNLNSGKQNVITISLSDSGGGEVIPERNGWSETPQYETTNKQEYITFYMPANAGPFSTKDRNYSMLYDKAERIALWVAYPLHASHMGSVSRSDWSFAPGLSQSEQPNVVAKSWPNESGVYDRGHQIASSDRTVTSSVNAMTFYVTNVTVQRISLNGGVWNKLENAIQQQAKSMRDTIYIVTGVMLNSKDGPSNEYTKDLSGNNVRIPSTFYKAIYRRVDGKDVTYGYSFPNIETSKGDNFNDPRYKRSVSQLEKETGYTFFPKVDKAVKDQVTEL